MKSNKQKLAENVLRQYIRKEIKKIMEAEDETAPAETTPEAPEKEEKPEPKEKPQPEAPAEEQGLNADFQAALDLFVRKLRSSTESVGTDDVVEMAGSFIDMFTGSSEEKLNVLKSIKSNIVK
jgi:hypothetical protein